MNGTPRLKLNLREALERRGITFYSLTKVLDAAEGAEHPVSYNAIYRLNREQPTQIGLNTLARIQAAVEAETGKRIPDEELWTYYRDA